MKQKEIFDKLANEERYEKQNLSKESSPKYFSVFKFSLKLSRDIRGGEITPQKAKNKNKTKRV